MEQLSYVGSKQGINEYLDRETENYYINQCSGNNQIGRTDTREYGEFSTFHQVGDKVVELQQRVVNDGADDIAYELEGVIISNDPFIK